MKSLIRSRYFYSLLILTSFLFCGNALAKKSVTPQKSTKTSASSGKKFSTDYLEFFIPKGWGCKLDNTAWVCRYDLPQKCYKSKEKGCLAARKLYSEAIMVLTAKQTGPKDSIRDYFRKLSNPFSIEVNSKKKISSKVIHTKKPTIKRQPWVDSLHVGSELPDYYTRYLATVKGPVAVIVTFSSHKKLYSKYSKTFFETLKTLRVKAAPVARATLSKNKSLLDPNVGNITNMGQAICKNSMDPTCQSPDLTLEQTLEKKIPFFKGKNKKIILLGAALVLMLLGLVIYKRAS